MDGRLIRAFLIVVLMTTLPEPSLADTLNNEWVSSTRSLSMGNTGIASAEDATTATFYNPAALAKLKKPALEVFNPQVEIGTGVLSLSGSIVDWGKHGGHGSSREMVKAKAGKVSSVGASLYPNVSSQNFSFGILARMHRWSYYQPSDATWRYYSRYLIVPTMGLSMAGLGGRFRLGLAVRLIQVTKTEGVEPDTAAGSTATLVNDTRNGLGIGLDAGMLLTMPWGALPTIGLVARNVGDTSFPSGGMVKIGSPTSSYFHQIVKMTYGAGFSVAPKLGQRDVLTFAVDYRDVTNRSGADPIRHFNTGFELSSNKRFFFRAGMSQGYWTAGIGIASKEGSFDIGTHAEELHQTKYRAVEDRHISMRISRRF